MGPYELIAIEASASTPTRWTEFEQHAKEEHEHMTAVAERIDQKENLIAERVAIDHYRESIRSFGERDPGTRTMPEGILVLEEQHTYDMHDLFVAHEGAPMLAG
jgi:bacterioferritin